MIFHCLRRLYFVSMNVISSFLIASFILVTFLSGRILALMSRWHCLHSKVDERRCRFCRAFSLLFHVFLFSSGRFEGFSFDGDGTSPFCTVLFTCFKLFRLTSSSFQRYFEQVLVSSKRTIPWPFA